MKEHRINIQKQKLDSQSILAHKNFNQLLHRYKGAKRMHYLNPLFAISGILLIILATSYFLFSVSPQHTSKGLPETIIKDSLPAENTPATQSLPPVNDSTKVLQTAPRQLADSIVRPEKADKTTEVKSRKLDSLRNITIDLAHNKGQRLKDFLVAFTQTPQYFKIDVTKDTVIEGSQGTQVVIPANSFVNAAGIPVEKTITIKVEEFYKVSDMIFAGLSTTSNQLPLESGGMVHIQALAANKHVELKEGKEITLKFPFTGDKKPMRLFTGKETMQGTINWLQTETVADQVFTVVEQMPVPEGGIEAYKQYISKNLTYPAEALKEGIRGDVFLSYIVEKDGSITDIRVMKGIGKECDQEAIRLIENAPKWIPGKQNGKPVRVRFSIPVPFILDSNSGSKNQNLLTPPNSSGETNSLIRNNRSDDYYYILKSNQLGWINCDRFISFNNQRTSLMVPDEEGNQTSVVLIFKNFKSIMPPNRKSDGNLVFDGISLHEEILILGLRVVDNTPFVAFEETTLGQAPQETLFLQFEQTTKKEFAAKLKKLLHTQ